jgi:hypothetical protein
MSNEPNDTLFVDPNTDDLDSFTALFNGKAQVKEESVESEPVEKPSAESDEPVEEVENSEDTPDEDDESPEVKPAPKKVNRFQERINELTAKAREAERALEALRQEQNKTDNTPTKPTPVVQPDADEPKPDALNPDGSEKYPLGEFDPQYIRDVARHTIDREWAARKEQEAAQENQRKIEEARTELQNQWAAKLQPAVEQYDDFLDKTMELESTFDGLDPQYSDYLVQTIKSLDHGPEVLYYFANHIEEAQKFVKMGPLNATLALGEINAMFKGNTRKETKVSKAPPPPQVNKGSKTRTAVHGDTDDLDAFSDMFFTKKRN